MANYSPFGACFVQISASNSFLTPTVRRNGQLSSEPLSQTNRVKQKQSRTAIDVENSNNTQNKNNPTTAIFKAAGQQNNVVFRLNVNEPQDRAIIKPSIEKYLSTENLSKREEIDSLVGLDVYV